MTLNDIIMNWNNINYQKKRQALEAIIRYIDYEDDSNDLLYNLIKIGESFENEDYFGTEGLNV